MILHHRVATAKALFVTQPLGDYIEMFYNPVRKHIRNGMLSPIEFERQQTLKAESV